MMNRVKRCHTERGKIFATYSFDRINTPNTEKSQKINTKRTSNPINKWAIKDTFQKKKYK
jgi:hypothetical protein